MATRQSFIHRHRWPFGVALGGLLAVTYLVMREADALLMLLESAGEQRYGMGAFNGWHDDGETARRAIAFWARSGGRPFEWVQVYAVADSLFAAGYSTLAFVALRRLCRAGFLRTRPWGRLACYAVVGLAFVADLVENLLTFAAAAVARGQVRGGLPVRTSWVADHEYVAGIVKWMAILVLVGVVLVGVADVHFGKDDPARAGTPRWWQVLWRLRVQVSVVVVLGFLVAVPSDDRLGALQQLPDVLRSYLTSVGVRPAPVLLSLVAPAFLGVAIWVSAHWLPYRATGTAAPGWAWPYHVLLALAALWTVLFVLQVVPGRPLTFFGVTAPPPWASGLKVALPSLLGALILGASWWLHRKYGWNSDAPARRRWHPRFGRVVNLLAVAPVLIAGLGLVRAAAGVALLPGAADRGVFGVLGGAGVAVVVAPLALYVLSRWAGRELVDDTSEPIAIGTVANVLTIGVTVLAIALLAAWPVRLGPQVGVPGLLAGAMVAATLGFGGLVAVGLRAQAFAVDLVTDTERKPIALPTVLLFLGTMAVVNLSDTADTYHEVRYQAAAGRPVIRTLAGHFSAWQQAVQSCGGPGLVPRGSPPRLQPLVFAAAAGGGIRAAYWTEEALLQLTGVDAGASAVEAQCRRDSVFLVSAVSGGSVGSALWSARPVGAARSATPYAERIAGEEALSAVGATWLFRDGARAMTGLNFGWPDRAAAMEQAWREQLSGAGVDLDQPVLPTESAWRPLLMLNGTDVQTGCRLVIGPVVPDKLTELPRNCQEVDEAGADLPGAYYLPEFLDTSNCDADGDHTLSTTTAALLSARFPLVTPTGLLYACSADRRKAVQVQIGDGGYLEASGIQAALQSWRALEPTVAQHNREVLDADPAQPPLLGNAVIVPVFVVIGNSYRSVAAASAPVPEGELLAPIAGSGAAKEGMAAARLEAEVRAALSRPVPGSTLAIPSFGVRVVVITPSSRPEITAPLGWALSAATRQTLDQQMVVQATDNTDLAILRQLMPGDTAVGPVTVTSQAP